MKRVNDFEKTSVFTSLNGKNITLHRENETKYSEISEPSVKVQVFVRFAAILELRVERQNFHMFFFLLQRNTYEQKLRGITYRGPEKTSTQKNLTIFFE